MPKYLLIFITRLKLNRLKKNKYFKTTLCNKSVELLHVLILSNIISKVNKDDNIYTIYFNKNIDFKISIFDSKKHSRNKRIRSNSDKHKTFYIINTEIGLLGTTNEQTKYPIWFELLLKK